MIFTSVLLYISKATGYGDIWLKLLTSKVLVLSAGCSSSALSWHLRPSHTTPATSLAFLTNESFIFYLYGHLPSLALPQIFLPLCCGFALCHHKFLWVALCHHKFLSPFCQRVTATDVFLGLPAKTSSFSPILQQVFVMSIFQGDLCSVKIITLDDCSHLVVT